MTSSHCLPSNFTAAYHLNRCSKFYSCKLHRRRSTPSVSTATRKRQQLCIVAVVFSHKSSLGDNGASESARVLLERLFLQTQKLEEKMTGDVQVACDIDSVINLDNLESDLHAALEALKRKEEDLHEAERVVMLENAELDRSKGEVEARMKEIAVVSSKREKLEHDLRHSSLKQISQERDIEDLKIQLKEREQEIASMQSALSSKEEQLQDMKNELIQKNEEVARASFDLQVKAKLLNDAEEIVSRQETELLQLRDMIREKEKDLEVFVAQRMLEEEKGKAMEEKLSEKMTDWLLAKDELKKLRLEASMHLEERNSIMDDFQRVKKLLDAVRSELHSSQQSLASSRRRMEEQEALLEGQLAELEEQKISITAYMSSLSDAQVEMENERLKLRVADSQNKELEKSLVMERDLVHNLQKELLKEKTSLCEANERVSFLQRELNKINAEYKEAGCLLYHKESELREARMEIQHMKSELLFLKHALEERDSELRIARKRMEEVNAEVAELRMLTKSKEDQLIQATYLLKEKDDFALALQGELNATKLKCNEAGRVVERIVSLTSKLVASAQEDHSTSLGVSTIKQPVEEPTDYHRLPTEDSKPELESTRDSLRMKELEVLAMQRSLNIKDKELEAVVEKLDAKEVELMRVKGGMPNDTNDMKNLCSLSQEITSGGTAVLEIEKLKWEATELEAKAATTALRNLEDLSRQLLGGLWFTSEDGTDAGISLVNGSDSDPLRTQMETNGCLTVFSSEIARLTKLTEELVVEAGIIQ